MHLFLSICLHSSFLVFLHIVMSKYDAQIRLTLLLVVLLTLPIYLGLFMPMVLMASLESVQWDITQMSWATLFLRVQER